MDTSWSEIQVKTLLNLLAPHPCLYDTYFAVYFTFHERHRMYEEICEKLRVVMPAVTVNQIKTKMKSLRRQFNQEMKLAQEAQERGKEYKPDLWCYDHLKFLQGRSESSSQSAEAVIVITDSDGQPDAVENCHARGNPIKKIKCAKNVTQLSGIQKSYSQESKHYVYAKRKRKVPKNHRKHILDVKSNRKSESNESVHDDNNYEGDIEDATVRSEKMPRPNAMFLVEYFQLLFSDGMHNSNNEYLLNNTAGYSYCFGAKHDAAISGASQVIENDHISCHTHGDDEMFNEQADYEELSEEKVQFITHFIENTNNNVDCEYLRGEYYMIDTSKHIIHSQGNKMDARNRENRQETSFYHKYQYMNLSLPILKSARYVRLCPETIEDDSYLHGAETNGENLETLSPFQTSGRSIRDILNASQQLESMEDLNMNFCSVTKSMMQTSNQEADMMKSSPAEGSYVANYLTYNENHAVVLTPNKNNSDPSWNKIIKNDTDDFPMLKNYVSSDTDSTTSTNDFKASVQTNMSGCKTLDSDSDENSIQMKNSSGMNQQIARDKYFFKKEDEHEVYEKCIASSFPNDSRQNTPTASNWLQEKPHCSKSDINNFKSQGHLENQSSFGKCPSDNPNCATEENPCPNSIGNISPENVDPNAHAGFAENHVDDARIPTLDKPGSSSVVFGSFLRRQSYAHSDFIKKMLEYNLANQIQNQEVEDENNDSDSEDNDVHYLDGDEDDDQSELTYDGYFNNSFLSQSENSSWHGSSKDSGNGDDSSCSFSSYERSWQLRL